MMGLNFGGYFAKIIINYTEELIIIAFQGSMIASSPRE
jgi:hypothetical protein